MTSGQATGFVAGTAIFGVVIILLFVGENYLEKSRRRDAGKEQPAPEIQTVAAPASDSQQPSPPDTTITTLATTGSSLVGGSQGDASGAEATVFLREAFQALQQKRYDDAMARVEEALKVSPDNTNAYELRGSIFAATNRWNEATKDYQRVLQMSGKNVQVEFDLAELEFMQKKYDAARPGFAALAQDPDAGDLAAYKVFLCDLWGGHDARAAQELEAFNKVGANPSYYFANASSLLYNHKTEEARGWLMSAGNIFSPAKFQLYAASLAGQGYLPLPAPATAGN